MTATQLLRQLSVCFFVACSLAYVGCDDTEPAKSDKNSTSGNRAGGAKGQTEGASIEGSDLKGIMLMHETEKAFDNGDMATAKAKLAELEQLKDHLASGQQKTVDEIRAKVLGSSTRPATAPSSK